MNGLRVWRLAVWSVTVLVLMLAAGCGSVASPEQMREAALRSADEVTIAAVWPFARDDNLFEEGLDLALEQIRLDGPLAGKRVNLVKKDDGDTVVRGMAVAQELAGDRSVAAVIGHRSSAVTLPVSEIYDQAGILLLAPSSTSPRLTEQNSSLIYRNIPSDIHIGGEIAEYLFQSGYRRVVIYYADDEYGRGLANAVEDRARELGVTIIDRLSDYKDAADARRIADKWQALGSEAAVIAAEGSEVLPFIRHLRAAGFDKLIIGGDGLDDLAFASAGSIVEGSLVVTVYHGDMPHEDNNRFRQLFLDRYGTEPDKWAAQAYDSLLLLADAARQAGSWLPRDLANALQQMKDWDGAGGKRSFAANGDVYDMEIVVKQMAGGSFILKDRVR
jgi:branched-chain amino acid transport system substrate-binding protein